MADSITKIKLLLLYTRLCSRAHPEQYRRIGRERTWRDEVLFFTLSLLCLFIPVAAQTVAVLTPDKAAASGAFASKITNRLDERLKVRDASLSETAYLSVSPDTPFNLTAEDSKKIGVAIGCDVFIMIRSATQRRSSLERSEYYESYAAIYVVSTRTGRLIFWKLQQFEAGKPEIAEKMLNDSVPTLASEIEIKIKAGIKEELSEPEAPDFDEVPEETSPVTIGFRPPVPYRRIKPEYTTQAFLYDIKATVDMIVFLDEKGVIVHTEIDRWAGFGLDESVEKTVRSMNWRPAERNGKALPMKFLVRYNFKKVE